jgi:hypothetical protein
MSLAMSSIEHAGHCASLDGLCAVVLLGGSIRPDSFSQSVGRPLFDLPLSAEKSILDHWRQETQALAKFLGRSSLSVRVMVGDAQAQHDSKAAESGAIELQIEQDPQSYRGTGGVLRDLCGDYGDQEMLLVANASQILLDSLVPLVNDLSAAGGDVSLVSHLDGTPAGMFLIRASALRQLPEAGFLDLKEQALPLIAKKHDVRVVHRRKPSALPVRTYMNYIDALRTYHQRGLGRLEEAHPFEETWDSNFNVIEKGGFVDPKARLHESVVLRGGRVEAGGVVVHSIVCPSGIVAAKSTAVDQLVGPLGRTNARS